MLLQLTLVVYLILMFTSYCSLPCVVYSRLVFTLCCCLPKAAMLCCSLKV
jgi:hypothetical protein